MKRGRHRLVHLGDLIRRLPDPTRNTGPWLITDMPRRDLYPDRCRPLGDRRIRSRHEERNVDHHVDRRAHPPIRHRCERPRPHPRLGNFGLPERRDPRRGPVPSNRRGASACHRLVAGRTGADLDALWVIEGVGTYGARLARAAADVGYAVAGAARMNARANRGVGKSDPLDARRIAQAVQPLKDGQLRRPRADDGVRAALRVLIASRDHVSTERTAAINALLALLRVVDLGVDARGNLTTTQIAAIAAWCSRTEELAIGIARAEAVRLAKRVRAVTTNCPPSLGR